MDQYQNFYHDDECFIYVKQGVRLNKDKIKFQEFFNKIYLYGNADVGGFACNINGKKSNIVISENTVLNVKVIIKGGRQVSSWCQNNISKCNPVFK